MDQTRPVDRDPWTYIGLGIPAIAAVVLSFAAWSGLAVQVEVDQWTGPLHLAWLLPLSVDALAMTATRIWVMDQTVTEQTRILARRVALGTIALSFAGNALFHLVNVLGMRSWSSWWAVVVLVTGLPAVLFGLTAHLTVRLRTDRRSTPLPVPLSPVGLAADSPPVGPAAPTPTGPGQTAPPLRRSAQRSGPVGQSQTTDERLAVLRAEWPDRVPSKRAVMDRLGIPGSQTAMDLRRKHQTWLAAKPLTDPAPTALHSVRSV